MFEGKSYFYLGAKEGLVERIHLNDKTKMESILRTDK